MPVITPIATGVCDAEASEVNIAKALVIVSQHCTGGVTVPDLWFDDTKQRNDLTISVNSQYIDIPTQASAIDRKEKSGKNAQIDISLGGDAEQMRTMAVIMDSVVQTDAVTPTVEYIDLSDDVGKPTYYQVAVIPYVGRNLDFSFGYVLLYGMAMADNTSFIFSPRNPKNTAFSFWGEIHPTIRARLRAYKSTDGTDVPDLVAAASEYVAANPQI